MKTENEKRATQEFVAEWVLKLVTAFYETPETLFDALIKSMLWFSLTEMEVIDICNEAIFTIKKTRITIADVLSDIAEKKRISVYNEKTGSTEYKILRANETEQAVIYRKL